MYRFTYNSNKNMVILTYNGSLFEFGRAIYAQQF